MNVPQPPTLKRMITTLLIAVPSILGAGYVVSLFRQELEQLHPQYRIEILFDLNLTHDSLIINGDEQLMKVLLINLMDNACKYSDDSSVKITLSCVSDKTISIEFLNNGSGIDGSELNKIFEPFYRGKLNKKVSGFGVGLSLAAKIMNLHDGKIFVTSIPGSETRFTINLPIYRAKQPV